ncbi:F-BAR domain only protein 2 isoform X5 [Ciona intestinalis]
MSHKNGIQASLPSIIAPALPNTMSLKFGSPARKTSAASDGGSPGGSKKASHSDKNGHQDKSRNGLQMLLMGNECELGEDYPAYKRQSSEGEKNNGFDVLYHNMKHGQISVKSLQDLFRESATTEDVYARHLTKLAKQAANSSPLGSFAPMFEVVKVMSEKLSSCHMDCVHKLHEIIKELAKYLEEQKNKHKQVKDELSGTADALHIIQTTTAAVNKSKEKYHQLCMETERLKRASAPNKEIEKAENKVKKSAEEYRAIVAKYATVRSEFEQKMTDSAKRFQEIEESHLRHMKGVLDNYILSFENANVLINQVHQEFRRQVGENTIASLIKQYSDSKGTGTEKPGLMIFEEWDPTTLVSIETSSTNGTLHEETQNPAPAKTRRPIALPFRRKKQRKSQRDMMNGSNTSKDTGTDKDGESIESPDKDPSVKIDEEGYTIRPETPKGSKNSWGMESSGSSDSDSDDYVSRKIHVKINPKDVTRAESGNNLDTLNAITRNLTLNSPTPVRNTYIYHSPGGKRLSPLNYNSKKNKDSPAADKQEKSMSDELLELFGGSSMSSVPPPPRKNSSKADSILELYSTKPDSPATAAKKDHLTPAPIPQSSSNVSLNNLFIMPEKDAEVVTSSPATSNHNSDHLSPSHNSVDSIELNTPEQTERPRNLSLTTAWDDLGKANNSSHSAPLASSESWSSLSSIGGTPMDSFASSRGPSPLTLMHGDPIPIAVAFTETVNAYFKGSDETRCMVKITGEVQMSFPAGIVRAFTSNPNPATLSFKVKGVSNIKDFAPNANLIFADGSELSAESRSFFFNMSALVNHVKKMTEANPNSPYYNIQVMSYQLSPASGYDMVPLHVTSSWKCEKDSTDVIVDYKCNTKLHLPPLKNVQIIVPVDGGVTSVQSVPPANWMSAQNRLSWKMPVPVSSMSAPTHLKSKLTLSNGPSRASALAVQFMSDGATLTGADFELTGSGYRLSLVKRKFVSGKYLSDGS